ncbi:MAG: putative dehydrogenase [Hyphomicrobiales bacterium]|nr:putative dehydrogenase [Hyphomicrobiales bacterium]
MKFCISGNGAMAHAHLKAIREIEGAVVTVIQSRTQAGAERAAAEYGVATATTDFERAIERADVDAVIITGPTQIHAAQAELAMRAGKHVLIEIPMCDSVADAERIVQVQKETGVTAMAGHVRRFNPSHQYLTRKFRAGEIRLQQLQAHTHFFRRTNMNALGQSRSWVDHLLWHHACHTVDLFSYQTGERVSEAFALQGPYDPELGIAMDMGIVMKTPSGAICVLSLSFNDEGPIGSPYRYICDKGTWVSFYDDLADGFGKKIDLTGVATSMNGFENQDREFIAAIRERRSPICSVSDALETMKLLGKLEDQLIAQAGLPA